MKSVGVSFTCSQHLVTRDTSPVRTFRAAWGASLATRHGAGGPGVDFTTAAAAGDPRLPVLARALARLCSELGLTRVVDVGCGDGALVRALTGLGLSCTGVELGEEIPAFEGLLIAHEWLDDVPCTVVDGSSEVMADGSLAPASLADLAWLERWWPVRSGPVESGLARDRAWADALDRLARGVAVCVDYGHTLASRPLQGTLSAHRAGVLVDPVADGSCWLTAHVALDSLEGRVVPDALERLGVTGDVRAPDCLAQRALLATPTTWVVAGRGGLTWP